MTQSEHATAKPGMNVLLVEAPPGLLDNLPIEDQQAIREALGKPMLLNGYDDNGRAELEFKDEGGVMHFIYIDPALIRPANRV